MKKEDIFPLIVKDFISATNEFSDEETGSYIRLLMKQWDSGGYISSDIQKLKRISDSVEKNWNLLSTKFKPTHELGLQNPKMEKVRKIWEEEFYHKGSKKKIEKKEKATEPLYFPYTSEKFLTTWTNLLEEKNWKNKSHRALQGSLKKLSLACEEDAIKMMENAINGGWMGVHELKPHEKHGSGQTNNYQTTRIGNSRNNQEASRSVAQNIDSTLREIEKLNNS